MTVAMWTTRMTTFMTDQLRECPFCNGDGELDIDENHNHFVSCIECRAEGSRAACASDAANAWNTRPTAVASHAEGEVGTLVTSCCGRSECGGECGNEWSGMVNTRDNHMPFMSDDDVERLSLQAGWEGNRKYMTKADFHIWCDRMRTFAALANPPRSSEESERTVKENLTVGDEAMPNGMPCLGCDSLSCKDCFSRAVAETTEALDAARYRWLRCDQTGAVEEAILIDRYGDVEVKLGDVLDQAIDAAMAAGGGSDE